MSGVSGDLPWWPDEVPEKCSWWPWTLHPRRHEDVCERKGGGGGGAREGWWRLKWSAARIRIRKIRCLFDAEDVFGFITYIACFVFLLLFFACVLFWFGLVWVCFGVFVVVSYCCFVLVFYVLLLLFVCLFVLMGREIYKWIRHCCLLFWVYYLFIDWGNLWSPYKGKTTTATGAAPPNPVIVIVLNVALLDAVVFLWSSRNFYSCWSRDCVVLIFYVVFGYLILILHCRSVGVQYCQQYNETVNRKCVWGGVGGRRD